MNHDHGADARVRAGYTLIEVLLATLLFGGGLVAVLDAYSHAARSTGEVAAILRGNAALQAQADLLLPGIVAPHDTGRGEDVCGEPYADYRWRMDQSDLMSLNRLREVTLSVRREGSLSRREAQTWVLRTTR